MSIRKIRGHRRRQGQIDRWVGREASIDLAAYLPRVRDRHYTKINTHPWCDISIRDSLIPKPKGKTKAKMLRGLLEIYHNWKAQLDAIGRPYYLKIWLFEPRFAKSQVVCAMGDSLDFYRNTFLKSDINKLLNTKSYPSEAGLEKFSWDYYPDEDIFDNTWVGEAEHYPSQRDFDEALDYFARLLKKPHRTIKLEKPIDGVVELYAFKRGDLWVGEWKKS